MTDDAESTSIGARGQSARLSEAVERARAGGAEKYHQKLAEQGKLFVRDRLQLLLDDTATWSEDCLLYTSDAADE